MNFINKQDSWNNLTFTFFPPFGNLFKRFEWDNGMDENLTFVLICSRTSGLISPVSPENSARNPCVLLLITSISCKETVCTTSFLFCNSPSGHCTKRVYFIGYKINIFYLVDRSHLWTHSVIVTCTCKRSTKFGYFTRCFVNCDHIPYLNTLFQLTTELPSRHFFRVH